jgi:hypothetical protein
MTCASGGRRPSPPLSLVTRLVGRHFLAGGFLESFLSGGAEIVLQDRPLLHLIDAWLCAELGEEDFIEALPLLRRSFTSFDGHARKRLIADAPGICCRSAIDA